MDVILGYVFVVIAVLSFGFMSVATLYAIRGWCETNLWPSDAPDRGDWS